MAAPARMTSPYAKPVSELRREIEANYVPGRSTKRPMHDRLAEILGLHDLRTDNQGKTATEIAHLVADQMIPGPAHKRTATDIDTLRKAIERYYKRGAA